MGPTQGWSVLYEDGDTGTIAGIVDNGEVKLLGESAPERHMLVPGAHVKCAYDDGDWFRGWILGAV